MDRLVKRVKGGLVIPRSMQLAMERLAAYEATGIEPDEIPHWIPVSERLPEEADGDENGEVLIYKRGEKWITKIEWVKEEGATHWQRLPQPPKGEKS